MCRIPYLLSFVLLFLSNASSATRMERHLFFLHNRFIQLNDPDAVHPEYGKAEYLEIVESFREDGFIVYSEKRPAETDFREYAKKVVVQIDSLLKNGVSPRNITVVGTSMGGYIAQYVSTWLANPGVNFVFVGAYMDPDITEFPDIHFCGHILNIYEATDPMGVSAIRRVHYSKLKVSRFEQIRLNTGLNHGFLYKALPEWIEPAKAWARGEFDPIDGARLTRQIDSLLATHTELPFNGTILVKQGEKVIYQRMVGYADLENKTPLKEESQFVIGSISKQITAVLVLRAYERGLLHLHVPIRRYLPELTQSWADSVTVDHLLTHMHGIAYIDEPLLFPAGSQLNYGLSNTGYDLLRKIVERCSGKSFALLSADLFRECGMKNTFHPDLKKHQNLVKGYSMNTTGQFGFDSNSFQNAVAAGGFISTAHDLILWNEKLHGGYLLNPKNYALLITKKPGAVRQHSLFGATEYAYGIPVYDKEDLLQLGQTGFTPGFPSLNFYFPESRTSCIVLQNTVNDPRDLGKSFFHHVEIARLVRKALSRLGMVAETRSYMDESDTLPYRLIYPVNENVMEKYPLVIYLHASGQRGNDNKAPLQKFVTTLTDSANRAQYPCYILVPQCPADDSWVWFPGFPNSLATPDTPSVAARQTLELIHELIRTKNIDPSRIYLTGFSLGGEGTFDLLTREPGLFACGVPLAAVADTSRATLIKDVPVWAFHGNEDNVNETKYTRMMIAALLRNGGTPKYTELPGQKHMIRDLVYADPLLWEWMFMQRKK